MGLFNGNYIGRVPEPSVTPGITGVTVSPTGSQPVATTKRRNAPVVCYASPTGTGNVETTPEIAPKTAAPGSTCESMGPNGTPGTEPGISIEGVDSMDQLREYIKELEAKKEEHAQAILKSDVFKQVQKWIVDKDEFEEKYKNNLNTDDLALSRLKGRLKTDLSNRKNELLNTSPIREYLEDSRALYRITNKYDNIIHEIAVLMQYKV